MTAEATRPGRPRTDVASVVRLTELADYVVPFALRVICDLGVADHLADGPLPVAELAAGTGSHPPTLLRCLRALAARGIFTETAPGVFGLTPLAQPLRADHPMSVRDAYPLLGADIRAWARLDHTLRTGTPSFDLVHGAGYWEHLAAHPADSARYTAAQQASTRLEVRTALAALDWASCGTVVDVGGGSGSFLAGILARFGGMRGVLLDLPHVVAAAPAVLTAHGVADRCQVVGGSFFDDVPAGADRYLLKRILAGWDDEHALRILRAVRAAMRPDSSLLLLEPVVRPGDDPEVGKLQDVQVVVMVGGGARGPDQLRDLLDRAGLRFARLIPTMLSPVVEVVVA